MRILTVFLCIASLYSAGLVASPRTLTFVGGFNRPPFVMQENQTGFELDLIRHVVERMGYQPHFTFSPFGRSPRLFRNTDVDAITTMNEHAIGNDAYLTDVYVTYENVIVTRASTPVSITGFEDLHKVSLAAFHNAHIVLGESYGQAVSEHPSYVELDNQKTQVSLFWQGRVEALVIEKNVFHYLSQVHDDTEAVRFHQIFTPTDYRIAFREQALANAFNQHFSGFRQTPEFAALKQQYLAKATR